MSNSEEKMATVIDCSHVSKSYMQGKQEVCVLNDLSFKIYRGDSIAIVGASGAGKSTLLNLLGGLDSCTRGKVSLLGNDLAVMKQTALAKLRNQEIGFVYQFHHLLSEFNALENAAMPLLIRGMKRKLAFKEAADILERVGLAARLQHRPSELSGGERQRVAIARALVAKPSCVLMDEPTGNLDEQTAEQVQTLLVELNQQFSTSFVLVTHDMHIARQQKRMLQLHEGRLTEVMSEAAADALV